jgi:hypothetical protein
LKQVKFSTTSRIGLTVLLFTAFKKDVEGVHQFRRRLFSVLLHIVSAIEISRRRARGRAQLILHLIDFRKLHLDGHRVGKQTTDLPIDVRIR